MLGRALCLLLIAGMAGCAAAAPDQPVARNVDLQRYAGHWYVIANIPYFAERGFVGSTFDISFPDGKVRDVYTGYKNVLSVAPDRFVMNGYVVAAVSLLSHCLCGPGLSDGIGRLSRQGLWLGAVSVTHDKRRGLSSGAAAVCRGWL
jgi:hypothetical protein